MHTLAPELLHVPDPQVVQAEFADPVEYEPATHEAQVNVDVDA